MGDEELPYAFKQFRLALEVWYHDLDGDKTAGMGKQHNPPQDNTSPSDTPLPKLDTTDDTDGTSASRRAVRHGR